MSDSKTVDTWAERCVEWFDDSGSEGGDKKSFNKFLAEHPDCPIGKTTLAKHFKRIRERRDKPRRGRPTSLSHEEEKTVIQRIRELEGSMTHVTNFMIQRELAHVAATSSLSAVGTSDEVSSLMKIVSVTNSSYLKRFKHRHSLKNHSKSRPVEFVRAVKTQPEISLEFFRLVCHLHAVIQIHSEIASGVRVEGWVLQDRQAVREGLGHSEPGTDLLEFNEETGQIIVKPLNQPLKFVPSER